MHPHDRLFGVEGQPIAAGELHIDVRVRSSWLGNRKAEEAIELDRTGDVLGEDWTTAEVNRTGMTGC